MTKTLRVWTAVAASLAAAPALAGDVLIDFEDLVLDTEYVHDDVFTSSGVDITVDTFFFSNGDPFDGGFTGVEDGGLAGGSGQDMEVNNVNLDFALPLDTIGITLLFGEYGGNVNLSVNGTLENVGEFDLLPATIGGVDVSVMDLGGSLGSITLSGPIVQFSIGGQELWIDDVLLTPGPGALALFAIGAALLRGRRRRCTNW